MKKMAGKKMKAKMHNSVDVVAANLVGFNCCGMIKGYPYKQAAALKEEECAAGATTIQPLSFVGINFLLSLMASFDRLLEMFRHGLGPLFHY